MYLGSPVISYIPTGGTLFACLIYSANIPVSSNFSGGYSCLNDLHKGFNVDLSILYYPGPIFFVALLITSVLRSDLVVNIKVDRAEDT